MKRILLSLCLVAASSTIVLAQAHNGGPAATTQVNKAKHDFQSKTNLLEAQIGRGNDQAKTTYEELKGIMGQLIADEKPKIAAAAPADRDAMTRRLSDMNQAYFKITQAAVDMKTNKVELIKELRKFNTYM